jgi:pilus assembly protein CpaB
MGRRTVLLVVALVIALVGSAMVYLYVRGADERAQAKQEPVEVLKAVAMIEPGETLTAAQTAGKLELQPVPSEQLLEGAMDSVGEGGSLVALSQVYPNEQITTSKFGSPGEQDQLALEKGQIAISVDMQGAANVAGFVSPGSEVAMFFRGIDDSKGGEEEGPEITRLLLPSVKVIAVGQTTMTTSKTTTDEGDTTEETTPITLYTLAVTQEEAEKIMYATKKGPETLMFGLLSDQSRVRPGDPITAANLFS